MNIEKKMKYLITLLLMPLLLTGCGMDTELKTQTANHIARPAFMVDRKINVNGFEIQAWERMHQRFTNATLYIGDDGYINYIEPERFDSFITEVSSDVNLNQETPDQYNPKKPNFDQRLRGPTPHNPVALHLASRDQSTNLVHLGRPCQYIKMADKKGCDIRYSWERRHAPEVIEAYHQALNEISARYDIHNFHLVGYGGGANTAAVLAAQRDDVISLRTVAGDLNPDFTAHVRDVQPLDTDSVLAIDYAQDLTMVPQHHFIGAADDIITPGAYHSYRQAVGLSDCIHYSMVADADHFRGWVEKWPELLALAPQCAVIHTNLDPLPPPPMDFPNSDYKKGLLKPYSK